MKTIKLFLSTVIIFSFVLSFNNIIAQELSVGADIVSKYMWRGLEVNKAPNIQPSMNLNVSGFDIGLWGSYSISDTEPGSYGHEIDGYIGYTATTESGDFGLLLTDYYFPTAGIHVGNFEGEGTGAHTLELSASYSGPISLMFAYNIHNDPGNNMYFQAGYSTAVGDVGLDLFVGGTAGSEDNPGYYGSENFAIINVGITGSKTIKVTDTFELPVFTSFILNPKAEIGYLVFGISF
ncbi:MAG: hypothetical protein A2068_07460 [Ignavibacteria bacterium GWB2_35_6b]|nr:MAG: hypothetical protein A2068_07460 [Ignavibacteria bacterium GWB2_35_6b]